MTVVAPSDRSRYNPGTSAAASGNTRRLAVIEQLLRLYPQVLIGGATGERGTGDRLLSMGADYRHPETLAVYPHWLELERCLGVMAQERNWQRCHVIAFYQAPTRITVAKVNVQRVDRYKRPMFTNEGKPILVRNQHGQPLTREERVALPVPLPSWVHESEAKAGLAWLEERYSHSAFKSAEAALARLRAA